MVSLPSLPRSLGKTAKETAELKGLNLSDIPQEGSLGESRNLSARRWPLIAPRLPRALAEGIEGCTALSAFDKLAAVAGGRLLWDGVEVGEVSEGEKQMALLNTKLCIWPDKVYLDLDVEAGETPELKSMEAELTLAGAVFSQSGTITGYAQGSLGQITQDSYTVWHDVDYNSARTGFYYYDKMTVDEEGNRTFSGGGWAKYDTGSSVKGTASIQGKYIVPSGSREEGFFFRRGTYAENEWSDVTAENTEGVWGVILFDWFGQAVYDGGESAQGIMTAQLYGPEESGEIAGLAAGNVVTLSGCELAVNDSQGVKLTALDGGYLKTEGTFVGAEFSVVNDTDRTAGTKFCVVDVTGSRHCFTPKLALEAGDVIYFQGIGLPDGGTGQYWVYDPEGVQRETGSTTVTNYAGYKDSWSGAVNLYGELTTVLYGTCTLARSAPDLDFICQSNNRLFGCSNQDKTIYACALGDPTSWYDYSGLSTDSYAVAVGSSGAFTGCCAYSSGVLFWKEHMVHKLLGSYPAEYALYDYSVEGVKAGCHKSLTVINEVLYYAGVKGVYAYTGGAPTLISALLGERRLSGCVGGTDGGRYFLSCMDGGKPRLLTYDSSAGLWLQEDGIRAVDFARIGEALYLADGEGRVWLTQAGREGDEGAWLSLVPEGPVEWAAQFLPFREEITGRKRLRRLLLRFQVPRGSRLRALVRLDGGAWQEAGKLVGRGEGTVSLAVRPNRCDRYEIRLEGKGECALLSLAREYSLGSER